jgi:hypothetical protein
MAKRFTIDQTFLKREKDPLMWVRAGRAVAKEEG